MEEFIGNKFWKLYIPGSVSLITGSETIPKFCTFVITGTWFIDWDEGTGCEEELVTDEHTF